MLNILLREMREFINNSSDAEIEEMMETLVEKLYDNCTTEMEKLSLSSIFTDAMEWR